MRNMQLLGTVLSSITCILFIFFNRVAADELVIPALVGQTGASAIFGHNEFNAYTLAVEEWNARGGVRGRQVKLIVEDTQTNQTSTITAFRRLAKRETFVVMGPTWLDGLQGIIPIAKRQNTLLITPSAAPETFDATNQDWPISFYHNTSKETEALISFLQERGAKKMALIYEEEPFAQLLKKITLAAGITPVAEIAAQAGEVDFQTSILKLKASIPDCILLFLWNERSLFSALREIKLLLPSVRIATIHDGIGWTKKESLTSVLQQLTYTEFELVDPSFSQRYIARFKEAPELTASNAYDAINAVLTGIESGYDSAATLSNYLRSSDLPSVTFGKFRFNSSGQVPSRIAVKEYTALKK